MLQSKFVEVQCAFAVVEVRKVTTNLSQTCGFAVAEHICSFAVFAVAELSVNLRCPALKIEGIHFTRGSKLHRFIEVNINSSFFSIMLY